MVLLQLMIPRDKLFSCLVIVLLSPAGVVANEGFWLDTARSSITTSELHHHASVLADDLLEGREAGSRGSRVAAKYIIEHLEKAGLTPAGNRQGYLQRFGRNYQNILAMVEGSDPELKDEFIVIGAHYDHVGYGNPTNSFGPFGYIHNGADDNASGVSALLEVIDALVISKHQPRRSILFAFWDGEEKGLLGSKHWIHHPTVPLSGVKLAVNVDMVGRLREGRIEIGGTRSTSEIRRLMSTPLLEEETWLDFTWEYKENSDHWSFYLAQIPSLFVHTGVHDEYHRPADDIETLNIDGIRQVSSYLLEQLCELADADSLADFRPESRRDTPSRRKRLEQPLPELPSRLNFTWQYIPGNPGHALVQEFTGQTQSSTELMPGDKIVAVDDHPLTTEALLPALAWQAESQLVLQVLREASDTPLTIIHPLSGNPIRLGLSWREDEAESNSVYVTRVVPDSPAERAEIRLFDRIYALNGQPIRGQQDFLQRVRSLLEEDIEQIDLEVESQGLLREATLHLDPLHQNTGDATL